MITKRTKCDSVPSNQPLISNMWHFITLLCLGKTPHEHSNYAKVLLRKYVFFKENMNISLWEKCALNYEQNLLQNWEKNIYKFPGKLVIYQ